MTHRPPIVLSFSGLTPAAISGYGSSWNQTPVIDSLAAASAVWDRCMVTNDHPDQAFHQFANRLLHRDTAPRAARELLTDVPSVIDHLESNQFDRVNLMLNDRSMVAGADDVDTHLAGMFATAIERINDRSHPKLFWLHSGSLIESWDAPRSAVPIDDLDDWEEPDSEGIHRDPAPNDSRSIEQPPSTFPSTSPPALELTGGEHPDLVSSWMQTYACQIQLIDTLLGTLLDSIDTDRQPILLFGTSGFRLGQGGWIGHSVGPLRSRDLHVPALYIASLSDIDTPSGIRFPRLVSSDTVASAIGEALGQTGRSETNPYRWETLQRLQTPLRIDSDRAENNLVTDEWFFVRDRDGTEHLYSKPDDIEDFNDVARVRPDVVALLDEQGTGLSDQ